MSISVCDMTKDIINIHHKINSESMPNMYIQFDDSTSLHVSKKVIQQLNFFNTKIGPDTDTYTFKLGLYSYVPHVNIFSLMYKQLKKYYLESNLGPLIFTQRKQNNISKLTKLKYQLEYLYLIKVLTTPGERSGMNLLSGIQWNNMLWVKLVKSKFENISDFFPLEYRILGYYSYVKILANKNLHFNTLATNMERNYPLRYSMNKYNNVFICNFLHCNHAKNMKDNYWEPYFLHENNALYCPDAMSSVQLPDLTDKKYPVELLMITSELNIFFDVGNIGTQKVQYTHTQTAQIAQIVQKGKKNYNNYFGYEDYQPIITITIPQSKILIFIRDREFISYKENINNIKQYPISVINNLKKTDWSIIFSNLDTMQVSSHVISQIDFFKFLISDDVTNEINNTIIFSHNDVYNPIMKIFEFMYQRLMFNYVKNSASNAELVSIYIKTPINIIDVFEMIETNDQVEYLKMLNYFTNSNERDNNFLLDKIKWTHMLWIHLLESKFENLNHFFPLLCRYRALLTSIIIITHNNNNNDKNMLGVYDLLKKSGHLSHMIDIIESNYIGWVENMECMSYISNFRISDDFYNMSEYLHHFFKINYEHPIFSRYSSLFVK